MNESDNEKLIFVLFTKYCSVDQNEKNEMGGECGTYGGRREVYTGFWWGKLSERDYLKEPSVDGRIILRKIFRKWDVGAWIESSWLRIGSGGGDL
jgi:hypothetical protein